MSITKHTTSSTTETIRRNLNLSANQTLNPTLNEVGQTAVVERITVRKRILTSDHVYARHYPVDPVINSPALPVHAAQSTPAPRLPARLS